MLAGKVARFLLSAEGELALKDMVSKSSLQAFVEHVDELGAWILFDDGSQANSSTLFLLKWQYFATAVVEADLTPIPTKTPVGFKA